MKILEYPISRKSDQYQCSLRHSVSEYTTLKSLHEAMVAEGWVLIPPQPSSGLPEGLENIWNLLIDSVNPKRVYGRVEHKIDGESEAVLDQSTGEWIEVFGDCGVQLDAEYVGFWWK